MPVDTTGRITRKIVADLNRFGVDARRILSSHEGSLARVVTLESSYSRLTGLNLKQDELLRQSLRCVESELFRAAHVLAFASLMDFIEERLARNHCNAVRKARPAWKVKRAEDLREVGSDYQVIEVFRELKHCTKTQEKALKGLLNRRNECAHPSDYFPGLNETLGFISEVMNRIGTFQTQWGSRKPVASGR